MSFASARLRNQVAGPWLGLGRRLRPHLLSTAAVALWANRLQKGHLGNWSTFILLGFRHAHECMLALQNSFPDVARGVCGLRTAPAVRGKSSGAALWRWPWCSLCLAGLWDSSRQATLPYAPAIEATMTRDRGCSLGYKPHPRTPLSSPRESHQWDTALLPIITPGS